MRLAREALQIFQRSLPLVVVVVQQLVVQVEEIEEMEVVQQEQEILLQLVHHKEIMEERPPWRRGWKQLVVAELRQLELVVHLAEQEMVVQEQQQVFQLLQRFMLVEVEVRPQVHSHQVQELEDPVVVEREILSMSLLCHVREPLLLEELILVVVEEEIIPGRPLVVEVAE